MFSTIYEKTHNFFVVFRQNNEQFTKIRKTKNQKVFIPNIFLELIINCISFCIITSAKLVL